MNFLATFDDGTDKIIKALENGFGQIGSGAGGGTSGFLDYLGSNAIFLFGFAVFMIILGIGTIHKLIKGG